MVDSLLPSIAFEQLLGGRVQVWRYPFEFSQSRLHGRQKASNACTIIALLLSERVQRDGARVELDVQMSTIAVPLADCIAIGNQIHALEVSKRPPLRSSSGGTSRPHLNFTVPQAIEACEGLVQEREFRSVVKTSISQALPVLWRRAIEFATAQGCEQLCLLLIAEQRTVLLVHHMDSLVCSVVDSHSHGQHGCIVGAARLEHLKGLCEWLATELYGKRDTAGGTLSESPPPELGFELSLIECDQCSGAEPGLHVLTGKRTC